MADKEVRVHVVVLEEEVMALLALKVALVVTGLKNTNIDIFIATADLVLIAAVRLVALTLIAC